MTTGSAAALPLRHVLSLSGGKDSAALAVYMRDRVPDMEYIFHDTDKELKETYDYLARLEAILGKPVLVGRHAGREGDDSVERVIIDRALYRQLTHVIAAILPIYADDEEIDRLAADGDIGSLTHWYGDHIEVGRVLRNLGWGR